VPVQRADSYAGQVGDLGGMSQGGFVSLRAALLAPGRVRGLILIDTQAGQEDPAVAPAYEQMHEVWRGLARSAARR
jgi:3-oxoadipate enol-lactonase